MKEGAVDERNGDYAIVAGLDHISFINGLAGDGIAHDRISAGYRDRAKNNAEHTDDRPDRPLVTELSCAAALSCGIAAKHTASPVSGAPHPLLGRSATSEFVVHPGMF